MTQQIGSRIKKNQQQEPAPTTTATAPIIRSSSTSPITSRNSAASLATTVVVAYEKATRGRKTNIQPSSRARDLTKFLGLALPRILVQRAACRSHGSPPAQQCHKADHRRRPSDGFSVCGSIPSYPQRQGRRSRVHQLNRSPSRLHRGWQRSRSEGRDREHRQDQVVGGPGSQQSGFGVGEPLYCAVADPDRRACHAVLLVDGFDRARSRFWSLVDRLPRDRSRDRDRTDCRLPASAESPEIKPVVRKLSLPAHGCARTRGPRAAVTSRIS